MNSAFINTKVDRRNFLKGGSAVVFALGGGGLSILTLDAAQAQGLAAAPRDIGPANLDTWLSLDTDGKVIAYFGKMDMGQGVDTAIAQVVAEELDVAVADVSVVMGDTHLTPNQGGASGSSGCRQGSIPLRNAAAEARRVLLVRAAEFLNVTAEELEVVDGTVFLRSAPERSVTYATLIADGFATQLNWNGTYGNGLNVTGQATPKTPAQYRVVGTGVARKDIPGKVRGTTEYCQHVTLPDMLHARCIRPPVANAVPVSVDESSIAAYPSARVVRKDDFIAVVAETEWHAIKAARDLQVTWSDTAPPFPPQEELFNYLRNAPAASDSSRGGFGARAYDPAPTLAAIAAAARQVEADYEVPFQSHARMGPSIALAWVKDGEALIYSDAQKPHNTRDGIAKFLGFAPENVRVVWKPGAGSYGRSDADEAAFEAALLSQLTGRPVRVQWMRHEGHAWDPKAPACVISCKAGLDAQNTVALWYFRARGFSGWDVGFNAAEPRDTLVGQLTGFAKGDEHNFGLPGESYEFEQAVRFWETVPTFLDRASPLRSAHMRAPQEPQIHFAHESFIDEVAAAAGLDPIALRLQHLRNPREIAVLEAVAQLSNWTTRSSSAAAPEDDILRGRGVSICTTFGGYVATVCEVEVERSTGRVWPRRFYVAHDCGLILNPRGLRATIEGNIVQGISRTLCEEVQFDERMVQSEDWLSYPILDVMDAPESIEIVTLNRPEEPPGGAGEPSHVTVPAAIANAVFDATGVRIRRLPLTAERVKTALG
ncbi:MAG: molybdopterin-dependent oxidoreductase [Pseudomonadales bacterium]|jgi:CO/xanthine dehydrogenase Mo-binding subunit|nr:molybdopterin-dependent oxidoreductase [Pseudomonadales bacterium]